MMCLTYPHNSCNVHVINEDELVSVFYLPLTQTCTAKHVMTDKKIAFLMFSFMQGKCKGPQLHSFDGFDLNLLFILKV